MKKKEKRKIPYNTQDDHRDRGNSVIHFSSETVKLKRSWTNHE